MSRIYPECLAMVRDIRPYAERIGRFDRDLAQQLRQSCTAVPLGVAEGCGRRAGNRRLSYERALGEARETLANLETAEATGYITDVDAHVRSRLDHIIGTWSTWSGDARGREAASEQLGGPPEVAARGRALRESRVSRLKFSNFI